MNILVVIIRMACKIKLVRIAGIENCRLKVVVCPGEKIGKIQLHWNMIFIYTHTHTQTHSLTHSLTLSQIHTHTDTNTHTEKQTHSLTHKQTPSHS